MYTIGLTGNIGCGKSTVLCMLQALGAHAVDADKLTHLVMEPGTDVWHAIVARFGQAILAPDGRIDRKALGRIVFSDPAALRHLEGIVHPAVDTEIRRHIRAAREPVVVIEAIKLIESGLARRLDSVWIITCRREQQLERLMVNRGLSYEEATQRIDAQTPIAERLLHAHILIDNSGLIEDTWRQVQAAWEEIPGLAPMPFFLEPPCGVPTSHTARSMGSGVLQRD